MAREAPGQRPNETAEAARVTEVKPSEQAAARADAKLPSTAPAQLLQQGVEAETALLTARYLHNRIQSTAEEKPGRHPDMSTAASAALRAVRTDLGAR